MSNVVRLTLLIAACFGAGTNGWGADQRPNILLIVSDDQGYGDLGCYGNREIITPHLDRLASDGVRLTNFCAAWPACTPSRASLLTGRYPQRHGLYDMIRNEAPDFGKKYTPAEYAVTFERIAGLDTRERLLSNYLAARGYRSGVVGKWDLGMQQRYLPRSRGFDFFYGFVNTGIDYFTHQRYGVPSMFRGRQPTTEKKGEYTTWLFEREAEKFIRESADQPFFLYLAFNAPHNASSLDPKIRSAAQATSELQQLYPRLAPTYDIVERDGKQVEVPTREHRRLNHMASITGMDQSIGRLLTLLEELEIADNTLVLFLSDNGGSGVADNGPLRGGKGTAWEGGLRVPCVARYPGVIPAGRVCEEFLTALEVVPTCLRLAGIEPPAGETFDGHDMLPVLAGTEESPRKAMFWQRRDLKAARVGDWKWVNTPKESGLYNLASDLGENEDLSANHPERLAELEQRFAEWEQEMSRAEVRGPFRDY
jgi:arylsulfatase A